MNRTDTTRLLERFTAAYGRHKPSPATIDEWTHQLTNTTNDDAHTALDRCIRTGQPGPNLAEFLALLPRHHQPDPHDNKPRHQPTTEETARIAIIWDDIRDQLTNMKHGRRR